MGYETLLTLVASPPLSATSNVDEFFYGTDHGRSVAKMRFGEPRSCSHDHFRDSVWKPLISRTTSYVHEASTACHIRSHLSLESESCVQTFCLSILSCI